MSTVTSQPTWQMNPVTTIPASASAQPRHPSRTPMESEHPPADDSASSHEVFGVGDQRGGLDAPAHGEFVLANELISQDADCRGPDPPAEMVCGAVTQQFVDVFNAGHDGARPDHQDDADAGEVPFAFVPIRVGVGGGAP